MKVVINYQNEYRPLLNKALSFLEQKYSPVEIVGVLNPRTYMAESKSMAFVNGKTIPVIGEEELASLEYDLLLVTGHEELLQPFLEEMRKLGLAIDNVVLDRTILMDGFSIERYKELQSSNLSILSMGEWSHWIANKMGLSGSMAALDMSDEEFLNFISEPENIFEDKLRNQLNLFNLLVVMYTEKPAVLEAFDRLPFAKKICFVPFETKLKSGFQISPYYVGRGNLLMGNNRTGERTFETAVQAIAYGKIVCFDLYDMLIDIKNTNVNVELKAWTGNNPEDIWLNFTDTDERIRYYNWDIVQYIGGKRRVFKRGVTNKTDDIWFTKFIKRNVPVDKNFNFFSLFGGNKFLKNCQLENKIFWTAEEVLPWPWCEGYEDYCITSVDLALGYRMTDSQKILRFPCWIEVLFEPTMERAKIESKIAEINAARNTKKYECVLINRHDVLDTRRPIYERLKTVLDIKCPCAWHYNTNEMKTGYNNDKLKYMHEFMFNICPENHNYPGYVTEKLIQAFVAGSIPIYYGSDNRPEPGVINPNAVLFWEPDSDNEALVREIMRLKTDESYYNKFMNQEKFFAKPAADYILSTFEELAKRLKAM